MENKVNICNIWINKITLREVLDSLDGFIKLRNTSYVVTPAQCFS